MFGANTFLPFTTSNRRTHLAGSGVLDDHLADSGAQNDGNSQGTNADSTSCPSGFVKGKCDASAKYKLPAHSRDFFTTWSFWLCCIAVVAAMLYAIGQCVVGVLECKAAKAGAGKPTSKAIKYLHIILTYMLAPLALCGASNSIGVLATSQQFLGWNFTQGIVVTDDAAATNTSLSQQMPMQMPIQMPMQVPMQQQTMQQQTSTSSSQLGMSLPFADAVFRDNFVVHIAPALAAFVVLLLLATGRNGPAIPQWRVMVVAIACMLVFLVLYLCVPASDENGKQYFGWDKIKYVYNDPQPWMFAAQLVFVALALVMVPCCLLSRKNPWTVACTAP